VNKQGLRINVSEALASIMRWKTHTVIGLAAGTMLTVKMGLPAEKVINGAILSAVVSIIPDFDAVGAGAVLARPIIGHRRATHSLVALGIVYVLAKIFMPANWIFIVTGYASHIMADMLNPSGIQLLWPIGPQIGIPIVRTGGIAERLLVFPAVCVALIWELAKYIV
jgi:inner membrane protein